jgi:uncharacterized membrane protein YfcA
VIVGAVLLNFISGHALKIYFAIYLAVVTLYGILQKEPQGGEEKVPSHTLMRVGGFFVGIVSVLLGIGGGTFTVPFFHFSHYPLKKAIAISSATGVFIGMAGVLGVILDGWEISGRPPLSLGYLHLPAFLFLTPGMMLFSPLGARTSHHLHPKLLKIFYLTFLGMMTGYMLWQALG